MSRLLTLRVRYCEGRQMKRGNVRCKPGETRLYPSLLFFALTVVPHIEAFAGFPTLLAPARHMFEKGEMFARGFHAECAGRGDYWFAQNAKFPDSFQRATEMNFFAREKAFVPTPGFFESFAACK